MGFKAHTPMSTRELGPEEEGAPWEQSNGGKAQLEKMGGKNGTNPQIEKKTLGPLEGDPQENPFLK